MPPTIARPLAPSLARPLVSALGGGRLPWDAEADSAPGEPSYYAHGWTDANYYQGPNGGGRGIIGTVRLVGFLLTLPATSQRVLCGRISAGSAGWRMQTGLDTAPTFSLLAGGATYGSATSPRHTFVAGDVGKLFVAHGWVDGTGVHLAIGGAEVGAGSGSIITVSDPGGTSLLTLGRYQHAGGFANPHIGIVALSATATVMTLSQIAADALAIMARPQRIALPTLPGEDMRFVAADATAGPWPDRIGNDCTLTETGAVSVSLVP